MTHSHFFGKDSEPLQGKAPLQWRVKNGPLDAATQASALAALNAFLNTVRTSTAENHDKTVALTGGGHIRMRSKFGVVSAEVVGPLSSKDPAGGEDFYGGIVVRPTVIPEGVEFFEPVYPAIGAAQDVRVLAPDVTVKGPATPGSRSLTTEHLVLQIVGDRPLGLTPVADGHVKIFRISEPFVGTFTEVNFTKKRYLLSTSDGSEFFYCGRKVTSLPPLPVELDLDRPVRLRTFNFGARSFETASKASGIVIVATGHELYATNTVDRAPGSTSTWALLHTASGPDGQNAFGLDFEEARTPEGVVTITCSGSNGAGVCSGFSVTITPRLNALPTIVGTVSPMGDGRIPAVAASSTFAKTVTNTAVPFSTFTYTYDRVSVAFTDDGPPLHTQTGTPTAFTETVTRDTIGYVTTTVTEYSITDEQPARLRDAFAGGFLPFREPRSQTWTWDTYVELAADSGRVSLDGLVGVQCDTYGAWYGTFRGVEGQYDPSFTGDSHVSLSLHDSADGLIKGAPAGVDSTYGPPVFTHFTESLCSASGEHSVPATYVGDGASGATLVLSADYFPPELAEPPTLTNSFVQTRTAAPGTVSLPPDEARRYTARDEHCLKLALLREAAWTATCAASSALDMPDVSDILDLNALNFGFPTPVTGSGLPHLETTTAAFDAATVSLELIRPDTTAVHDWGSLLDGSGMNALTPRSMSTTEYSRLPIEGMLGPSYQAPLGASHQIYAGIFPALTRLVSYVAERSFPGDPSISHVTPAAYAAMFPGSIYAVDPPLDLPDFITAQSIPEDLPTFLNYAFTHPSLEDDLQAERDVIYRDLRTGGFVTQVLWKTRHGFGASAPYGRYLDTRIGNDFGTVPLVDVLNEWVLTQYPERREVGYIGAPPLSKVFIDHDDFSIRVSLI